MIFVTVGSAKEPFDRLLRAMDELAPRLGEPVVMQCGRRPYPGRHTRCLGYISFGQMQRLVAACRVLVGHGSTGPVLLARRYGKPLVMVPRLREFGETSDAHPLEAARSLERRGDRMTEVVYDIADLEAAIRRAQKKADLGWTYEPDPERERLLAAVRVAVEGRLDAESATAEPPWGAGAPGAPSAPPAGPAPVSADADGRGATGPRAPAAARTGARLAREGPAPPPAAVPPDRAWAERSLWTWVFGLLRGNLGAMLTNQALVTVMNVVVLVLINRVYASAASAADAGRLAGVMALVLGAVLVGASGVARAVTVRIARARAEGGDRPQEAIGRTIGAGLVLGGGVGLGLLAAGLLVPPVLARLAEAWWPAPAVAAYVGPLRTAALWFPPFALVLVMVAVFDGYQRMRWSLLAEAGTFQTLRFLGAVVAMAVLGLSWTGLLGVWAAAYALGAAAVAAELAWFLGRRGQRVRWRGLPVRGLARDAFYMFLPTVAPMLVSQAGVLVAWVVGGAEASATFWVTWSIATAATQVCQPVGRVLLPAVPNLRARPDPKDLARALRGAFWGVAGVMLGGIALVEAVEAPLLAYLNQPGRGAMLTVLLAAGFFETYRVVFGPVLLATGRERAATVLEWAVLGTLVLGGGAAMATGGLMALAAVFLGVYVTAAVVRLVLATRATGVGLWLDAAVSTALVLGAAAAMVAWQG